MITIKARGDFSKAEGLLKKMRTKLRYMKLESYGQMGVEALSAATPKRSGLTASSWFYTIEQNDDSATITWDNSNVVNGWAKIAVFIQMGHGTRNGGYVQGIDYINPAMKPVFEKIAKSAWKEVSSL